jgi:putative transposase
MGRARKQYSRGEIARKLAQANRLARQGKLQSEIARTLGVSVMTLHRWRKALLGARPAHKAGQPDPTRSGDQIAQLQLENSLLRRLVTDLLLLEKIKRRHQRPSWGRWWRRRQKIAWVSGAQFARQPAIAEQSRLMSTRATLGAIIQLRELPRARKACQRCLAASFRLTS